MLTKTGLLERAKDAVKSFSGGMKRRINIACALLHKPKLLIFDEPNVGIDPQSRNHIFEMIRHLKKGGVTIIYSTHYMEEVEALCDDIAIIDHGNVIAQGHLGACSNDLLKKQSIWKRTPLSTLNHWNMSKKMLSEKKHGWVLETDHPLDMMRTLLNRQAKEKSFDIEDIEMMKPSLETVFLSLTGKNLRD
ncbi:ABC transporter ATP-binding protein [Terrilactibacillus sp. S3-3]|nr:ABC transporter ATP-binding protein [Terrilactibacillus sp. S3-3]